MMKRALIVGIDDYADSPLEGCVDDAKRIARLLERNDDNSPNFTCKLQTTPTNQVTRSSLKQNIEDLFKDPADMALFYFSGHGTRNIFGGYLVTQDAKRFDEGVSMQEVLSIANSSRVKEIVIIVDCCYSGVFGTLDISEDKAILREGIAILAASRASQEAAISGGSSIFTKLICDALEGGASDVRGEVNVASAYSYADETLGAWDQRPMFKAHVSKLTELRMCKPQVPLEILRKIIDYFPEEDYEYPLDPSYEPDKPEGYAGEINKEHEKVFGHLQQYRSARLLVPVGEEHMYFAAMNSKSCKLTPLGHFYRELVRRKKI